MDSNFETNPNIFLESSMEHLEVKRQILALRAKYGEENWLSNHSAQCVQNIMGMEIPAITVESIISSTFKDSQQNIAGMPFLESNTKSVSPIMPSTTNFSEETEGDNTVVKVVNTL